MVRTQVFCFRHQGALSRPLLRAVRDSEALRSLGVPVDLRVFVNCRPLLQDVSERTVANAAELLVAMIKDGRGGGRGRLGRVPEPSSGQGSGREVGEPGERGGRRAIGEGGWAAPAAIAGGG